MIMNTHDQYGLITRLLHWLIFVLVFGMLLGGGLLAILPSGGFKNYIVGIHKSFGVVVFGLMLARLVWRRYNIRPRPLGMIPVLNYSGQVMHVCLYVLLLFQPLMGILMSQSFGYPVSVFGWFELPPLIWHSPAIGNVLFEVHSKTAIVLTAAIAIHAAAGLVHHFIFQDRTLMRMIKG